MRGYKGFNKDMTCRGFKYEVGKSYHMDGDISTCSRGFHFCPNLKDCFQYYSPENSVFCEIEASGTIDHRHQDKKCCSDITIVRLITNFIEINRAIYGNGNGNGDGNGNGNGNGNGYGYGYGDGYGYGNGNGNGDGNGDGYGYGDGNGYGYGYGNGNGYGYGYGYGENIQKILTYKEIEV